MASSQPVVDRSDRSFLNTLIHSLVRDAHESRGGLRRQAWLIEKHGTLCIYRDVSRDKSGTSIFELAELRAGAIKEGWPVSSYIAYPSPSPTTFAILIETPMNSRIYDAVWMMEDIARQARTIRNSRNSDFGRLLHQAATSESEAANRRYYIQ
jgi:hypothetical protein